MQSEETSLEAASRPERLMTVYILYSQFTDDPSHVRGIFTTLEKLMEAYNSWDDPYKDWVEAELDTIYSYPDLTLN